jgi:hypothetical protein
MTGEHVPLSFSAYSIVGRYKSVEDWVMHHLDLLHKSGRPGRDTWAAFAQTLRKIPGTSTSELDDEVSYSELFKIQDAPSHNPYAALLRIPG